MGIFDRFPYSSTHEMNLDFMLGKATEIAEDMQTVATGMAQVQAGLSAISEKTEQATEAAAQAAASASSIEGSVTAAEEAAEEAQMHNESAQTWANNALTYKADCQRAASEAAASSTAAAQAATAAAASEDTVATYAQAANASAQSAANNNDSAHQYANQASASASNATFHSSNAQTAATNANTSATNAETAATNAQTAATRAATLKDDVETLHRMCVTAVDQSATQAVNAANSAAQAAATKTDVENLVESLPEDFTDLNNTVNQLSDEIDDIGSDVTDLKSAIDAYFTQINLAGNATFTGYYYVNYTDGTNKAGNSYKASSMIDISGCTKIMYDRLYTSNSTSYAGIAFYDENQAFIANSGIPAVFNQSVGGYKLESADVPTGAKYVRLSGGRSWDTIMRVYDYNDYIEKVPVRLDALDVRANQISTDVQKTNGRIDNIGERESIGNVMAFQRGYWNAIDSFKTSANYRVGCSTPITFSKKVHISALNGFGMSGYIGSTYFNNYGTITVPANTEFRLFIRRVWEDETESADIDEFTSGIYILDYNPSTEYDLRLDTFAGIEMFRSAAFIGDSYTATRLGYSWVDILQNITGVTCTKFAKSGADSGAWLTAQSYGLPALLSDTQKDLYWLALGINDGDRVDENSNYLGTIADISGSYAQYPDTFYGNTGHIIEAIPNYAPNAKIVLYKPIFKSVQRTLTGVSATQNGIKLVRDAIGEIAEHYSLPYMDALDDVLFQSPWYTESMDSAVSQGTHPSIPLYPAIARANMRLMSKCIQTFPNYFRDVRYDN